MAASTGQACLHWRRGVGRAAAFYMAAQMEAGHCCPITMTSAAVPVVRQESNIAEAWLPRILAATTIRHSGRTSRNAP
jgi:hypothetical protein